MAPRYLPPLGARSGCSGYTAVAGFTCDKADRKAAVDRLGRYGHTLGTSVKGIAATVLQPDRHASLVHRSTNRQVVIWTPDREPRWRTRRASDAISLLAHEIRAENVFFSVNQFNGRRQVRHLAALNALYVDVDSHQGEVNLSALMDDRLGAVSRAGVPEPSLIVFSGRGLHFYWIINPTPAAALPRWQACQRHLQRLLQGDPAAVDCTRLLRAIGSVNARAPEACRTVTGILLSTSSFDFDWLAAEILPRSRAEVRDIRAMRARKDGSSRSAGSPGKRSIFDWWMAVYRDLYLIIDHHWPRGVAEGHRDRIVFLLAVALSWFTTGDALDAEVVSVARRVAPTLTVAETLSYTSSVRDRAARASAGERDEWRGRLRDPRYHFKRETLYDWLADLIPPALEQNLTAIMSTRERDRRRSEREGARDRAAEGRHRSSHALDETRTRARLMSLEGHSVRAIASMLAVPRSTVADWLRSANTS